MIRTTLSPSRRTALLLLSATLPWAACGGDDSTGPGDSGTGATLQGTVTAFETGQAAVVSTPVTLFSVPGVAVTIGSKSVVTDAAGGFTIQDIPTGDHAVTFSKEGITGTYYVQGIVAGGTITLDEVQYSGGHVATKHTGTWIGTGGSSDSSSQGQIALTMILSVDGNALSGTATGAAPDSSVWSIEGTETGTAVSGSMSLVTSNDECATGGDYTGEFSADTLKGDFVEVDPPDGCGDPESGTFRVVKQ
jgi:hypothetical protein